MPPYQVGGKATKYIAVFTKEEREWLDAWHVMKCVAKTKVCIAEAGMRVGRWSRAVKKTVRFWAGNAKTAE